MNSSVRRAALLAAVALLLGASAALAASVKVGAVKGAKYAGTVRDEAVTVTVAANGKSAKVSIPFAPAFCQGGGGGEVQHTQSAPVKGGELTAKISYTVEHSSRVFATVTIKGTFMNSNFDGQLKSSFTPAKECDGQESFFATTSKK
ncbi:MAG TPA: hypothetical protein VK761_00760 [Solirubrobacteraceae bacterium]|nr:hypothetical protein [Solirubrobacteraceae bacterium]